jgi:hypothetical protein
MQLNENEYKNRVRQWIISSFPYAKGKYVMDIQNDNKYNLIYVASKYFGFERTWWRLFQKRPQFNINVFIKQYIISIQKGERNETTRTTTSGCM